MPPPPGIPQMPGTAAPPAAAPPPQPAGYPKSGPGWVCLYPGCDGAPEFDAPARLRGPGDSYLAHILAATGCTARVAGKGSGAPPPPAGELEPPLHLRLEHADAAQLEEGRRWACLVGVGWNSMLLCRLGCEDSSDAAQLEEGGAQVCMPAWSFRSKRVLAMAVGCTQESMLRW